MPDIFHIARAADWQAALAAGTYRVSTLDRSLDEEGFIHCSTREQVPRVANALYRGTPGLVLLVIDVDRVGPAIRYEAPDGGTERFPHIYGPLNVDAVVAVAPFEPGEGGLLFPTYPENR